MSNCSSCVVAGSTMSANSAVSVMNCSLTTVNKSSRINRATSFSCSGQTTNGLEVVDHQNP